jgi:hypothetical protein
MLRIRDRLERLEAEILPLRNPGPREMMTVQFVDEQKNVVSTLEFQMAGVRPPKRRGGLAPARRQW